MKLLILMALFVCLEFPQCRAEPDTGPFDVVGRAIEEVIAQELAYSKKPGAFSVTIDTASQADQNAEHLVLPNDIKERLKIRLPEIWKDYLDLSELRFPEPDEKEPEGTKLRGIENKAGDRVHVFCIREIKYISANKLLILWYYRSGPQSIIGGTDEVSISKDGWKVDQKSSYGLKELIKTDPPTDAVEQRIQR